MGRKQAEFEKKIGENIFTHGVYHGRSDRDGTVKIFDILLDEACFLVAKRADEDGLWCIQNDLVGDNVEKMKRMMNYVKDPVNVARAFEYLRRENRTDADINFLARDLANGSKWAKLDPEGSE